MKSFYGFLFVDLVLGFLFLQVGAQGDFIFGFHHNGERIFWGSGKKLPEQIEPDIRNANMTTLLSWINMADKIKDNFLQMKENAKQCGSTYNNYGMADYAEMGPPDPQEFLRHPPPEMAPKIDEAIEKITIYENRLLEELRKSEKDWNYSKESSPDSE